MINGVFGFLSYFIILELTGSASFHTLIIINKFWNNEKVICNTKQ